MGNVAALTYLLRPYLMSREDLLDYYHDEFRAAVVANWLDTDQARRQAHRTLADYFRRRARAVSDATWKPDNGRALSEHYYQCVSSKNWPTCAALLEDDQFLTACFRADVIDLVLKDAVRARRMLGDAVEGASARAKWQLSLLVQSDVVAEAVELGKRGQPWLSEQDLRGLPAALVAKQLETALRRFATQSERSADAKLAISRLMERHAQGNDELLKKAVHVPASDGDVATAWDLSKHIINVSTRVDAMAYCLHMGNVPASEIMYEVERIRGAGSPDFDTLSTDMHRSPILVHGARHFVGMEGRRFCEWVGSVLTSDDFEIPVLAEYVKGLPAGNETRILHVVEYLLFELAQVHTLSSARRHALQVGLLMSRALPVGDRRTLLERTGSVCDRVGDDTYDARSWAWYALAVEWAPINQAEALSCLRHVAYVTPMACGLLVIAAHCSTRDDAVQLLYFALTLLPECADQAGGWGLFVSPRTFLRLSDFSRNDLIPAFEVQRGERQYAVAALCGQCARWGLDDIATRLRARCVELFGSDHGSLTASDWGRAGGAGLESRPECSPSEALWNRRPLFTSGPDYLYQEPSPPAAEPIATQAEMSNNVDTNDVTGFVDILTKLRARVASAPKNRGKTRSRQTPAPNAPGRVPPRTLLSADEADAAIDDLPRRMAQCDFAGRGFRDDYLLGELGPVFAAWRAMTAKQVAPQAEKLAEMLPKLWTGKRTGIPYKIADAAAAVDAYLGVRILQLLCPRQSQNPARMLLQRLEACGPDELNEALSLCRSLIGDREELSTVVENLVRLAREAPAPYRTEIDDLVVKAVKAGTTHVLGGRAVHSLGAHLGSLRPEEATRAIVRLFDVMVEVTHTSGTSEGLAVLLESILPRVHAGELARILAHYQGPADVLWDVLWTVERELEEEVLSILKGPAGSSARENLDR